MLCSRTRLPGSRVCRMAMATPKHRLSAVDTVLGLAARLLSRLQDGSREGHKVIGTRTVSSLRRERSLQEATRPPHFGHTPSASYPPVAYGGHPPPAPHPSPGHARPPAPLYPPYGAPEDFHRDARPASMSAPPLPPAAPPHHDSRGWTPEGTPIQTPADPSYFPERLGSGYPQGYPPPESTWRKDSAYGRDDRSMPPAHSGAPGGHGEWDKHHGAPIRPWGSSSDDRWPRQHRYSQSSQSQSTTGMPFVTSPTPAPAVIYPDSYGERVTTTASSSHYSRVLVGSMGAVCQRLKDLDGETGLFFFAHDLGIRTEGTFSLRFTLADLTSLSMQHIVKDQHTPILARIFSSSFTVYSAKRFPGVLPTTALTQCFADQSVRLPTRQKRSTPTSGSKRKK